MLPEQELVGEYVYFSICVPQYNRAAFFIESLRSYQRQSFADFEVCISDGGSQPAELERIEEFLQTSKLRYQLRKSPNNLRYDENLRNAISMSTGKYVLLMGNDDALSTTDVLDKLEKHLEQYAPAVAITNYQELSTGKYYRRMVTTEVLGGGPGVAAKTFRHYAFVSGIILDGAAARAAPTTMCDGSEMYQMYLGSRLVSEGGRFLSIDDRCIDKDVQIVGEAVDSYAKRPKVPRWPIIERRLPMGRIFATVASGLRTIPTREAAKALASVARQLYVFTYPYWIFEYRRVQSYSYSLGVYMALRPSVTLAGAPVPLTARVEAWLLYLSAGLVGFLIPLSIFDAARPILYRLAKR